MRAALLAQGLRRTFGGRPGHPEIVALDDAHLVVLAGECVGLVGPNGAGKSTLLKIAAGLLTAHGGALWVAGRRAGSAGARRLVGYAPEHPAYYPELTVREVLAHLVAAHERGAAVRGRLVDDALAFGGLEPWADRRTRTLSRGMGQRLALAQAALGRRELVLLDETLSGIDPLARRDVRNRVLSLTERGVAVVIASHDLAVVERLAHRVAILQGGRTVRTVTPAELAAGRSLVLVVEGSPREAADLLAERYPQVVLEPSGARIAIGSRESPEGVLAFCRERRIAVRASCVVARSLEDEALDTLTMEERR